MGTSGNWRERRQLLLHTTPVHTQLASLIAGAKTNTLSLAVFKPTKVLDFVWEEEEAEWDAARVAEMRERTQQRELFAEDEWRETFKLVRKLPYSFSYRFEDETRREHTMQVLDWETGALFWKCLKAAQGDAQAAIAKVRAECFDEFQRRDLHFFLGTTQQFHFVAPNPWVIIGVFPIPYQLQGELF